MIFTSVQADWRAILARTAGILACLVVGVRAEAEDPLDRLRAGQGPGELDLFGVTNVLQMDIEIPDAGLLVLRNTRFRDSDKPKAMASVREGGQLYTNVSVQLKGFTSFRSIDDRPSLTLSFDRLASGQRFHGLSKISLNNSVQDNTRLNEKIARELFAAAGVPVPRADFARVTLNGRKLGLYVVTEGFDRAFLRRHFKRADGTLFQGGVMQDIDRPLEVNVEGKVPGGEEAVRRLVAAACVTEASERWDALCACLDMDRFVSMQAMETILCHSDSYSMNRNNYRLYLDPESGKLVFLPHGMDRVLGTHRSGLDLCAMPPVMGLVSRAMLSTDEGRRRHLERVGTLLTNAFDPVRLCERLHALDARLNGIGAKGLCDKIEERAMDLKLQLADGPALLPLPPLLEFDEQGVARLPCWRLRPRASQTPVSCDEERSDGKTLLVLRSREKGKPLEASLSVRVRLPVGRYRLEGRLAVEGGDASVMLTQMVRNTTGRFGYSRKTLDGRGAGFQVMASQAPEEIEFTCDILDALAEVRLDASGLRVVKE